MKLSVLWIDDVPEESQFFKGCLINNGIDLVVANSFFEACYNIANSEYDAFVLRPDLKIFGGSYSPSPSPNRLLFLNNICYELRQSKLNNDKLLYIATFNRNILNAVKKGHFERGSILRYDSLTKLIYMADERPSQFAYNLEEEILTRELANFKSRRKSSRTDG